MPSAADIMQHRTDGTDAFDTLYIGAEKFPYRDAFSVNISGVLWKNFAKFAYLRLNKIGVLNFC